MDRVKKERNPNSAPISTRALLHDNESYCEVLKCQNRRHYWYNIQNLHIPSPLSPQNLHSFAPLGVDFYIIFLLALLGKYHTYA